MGIRQDNRRRILRRPDIRRAARAPDRVRSVGNRRERIRAGESAIPVRRSRPDEIGGDGPRTNNIATTASGTATIGTEPAARADALERAPAFFARYLRP
jgi:hypothetical protein